MPSDDLQRFLLLCQEKSRTSLDKCAVCMGNEAVRRDHLLTRDCPEAHVHLPFLSLFLSGLSNTQGDLDSLASALAYAYLGSLLDPSTTVIPLFQQGRHDFALRPENYYALQEAGLAPDLVLTLDDLPADTLRDSSCRVSIHTPLLLLRDRSSKLTLLLDSTRSSTTIRSRNPTKTITNRQTVSQLS